MNLLDRHRQVLVVSMLCNGVGIRMIERTLGVNRNTVMAWLKRAGRHCAQLWNTQMRGIHCDRVEADEVWGYVGRKANEIYIFVAMDPKTKLVVAYDVDRRDRQTTFRFIKDLADRVDGRFHLCTDGWGYYVPAVQRYLAGRVDFVQIVKDFARLPKKRWEWVHGYPREDYISTSYIERQNGTLRTLQRRMVRKTLCFSKSMENLRHAIALHYCYYNFVKGHRSLDNMTPAMAHGIAAGFWGVDKLLPPN